MFEKLVLRRDLAQRYSSATRRNGVDPTMEGHFAGESVHMGIGCSWEQGMHVSERMLVVHDDHLGHIVPLRPRQDRDGARTVVMPTLMCSTEPVWGEIGATVTAYVQRVLWPLIVASDPARAKEMVRTTPEFTPVQLLDEGGDLLPEERFRSYVQRLGSVCRVVDERSRCVLLVWHFLPGTPLSSVT